MRLPKRILLVEDAAKDVELTCAVLEEQKLKHDLVVARDGGEALDYLYRRGKFSARGPGNPDVVLLDIKMPRVNGLEVLQRIKADPQLHSIPVVMLTSSREEKDVKSSYAMGANAYVVKPVNFNEFAEALRAVGAFWVSLNETPPMRD